MFRYCVEKSFFGFLPQPFEKRFSVQLLEPIINGIFEEFGELNKCDVIKYILERTESKDTKSNRLKVHHTYDWVSFVVIL